MDGGSNGPDNLNHLVSHLNLGTSAWPPSPASPSPTADGARLQNAIPAVYPSATAADLDSLFSSGPSAPSPPSSSGRPLPTPRASSRRTARFTEGLPGSPRTPIARAEKDADDPTTPVGSRRSNERSEYQTLTTLSRLFAGNAPSASRGTSYTQIRSASMSAMVAGSLPNHLYARGLLDGRHSDIAVIAFGKKYSLHRLILDQAPFFEKMLSGPWRESRSEEVTLHPDEVDSCITEAAFELTLKRLYGCDISEEEDAECLGLFATACWLEMQDLIDSSIDAILRRMHPDNLGPLIKLVTLQYYGQAGERLLASAKAMLCRDGCEMKLRNWDEIPGEVIREIVGGDGFYINGEWERWILAKRLLDRRLKKIAAELGLIQPGKPRKTRALDTLGLMAVRFDSVYRQNAITTGLSRREQPMNEQQRWIALYTHHEIEPLLVLLEEGIHYIHLEFEQLQFIRTARDIFGLAVVSEKAITNALWMQMELRQRVMAANAQNLELGLSKSAEQEHTIPHPPKSPAMSSSTSSVKGKGAAISTPTEAEDEEMDSGSWDANGRPRKFWIPSADCNIVMGGAAEPFVTTTNSSPRHASRLSATLQPEDVQWATDFSVSPDANRTPTPFRTGKDGALPAKPNGISYTHFPPFRFAAEFPNPRLPKGKKRVYSRTVFYAGSLWNIYIQKVRSAKNPQLGVYLHRAKEYAPEEGTATSSDITSASVRIGELERRILSTERSQRRSRQAEQVATAMMGIGPEQDDTSGSGGDLDIGALSTGPSRTNSLTERPGRRQAPDDMFASPSMPEWMRTPWGGVDSSDSSDNEDTNGSRYRLPMHRPSTSSLSSSKHGHETTKLERPTIPPYIDGRPTIKTYFKIYSPSKGGRLLSVYESAPDKFNFSQSWGWKSSTLMLDDAVSVSSVPAAGAAAGSGGVDADGLVAGDGGSADGDTGESKRPRREQRVEGARQQEEGRRLAQIHGRHRELGETDG